MEGAPALSNLGRGTVNLARHWVRGKVATRARIVQGSFPVARLKLSRPLGWIISHELSEVWGGLPLRHGAP